MLTYLKLDNQYIQNLFNKKENFFTLGNNIFKEKFKDLWVKNGDELSIQYAGTPSTITTVTKTGGHGIMGFIQHGFATAKRIYQGNVEDNYKQQYIDILLQKGISEHFNIDPAINYELLNRKNEYTRFQDISMFIGTYNLSGKNMDNAIDVVTWLLSYKENPLNNDNLNNLTPDFYIIGFQEIVDLNSTNLLIKSNTDKKDKLKTIIFNLLKTTLQSSTTDNYQLMKELDLIGLYVLVFVKTSLINYIKNFDYQIIKTGLKGAFGNKGSLLLRFNINDSKIALSCSHLSSGQDKNEERKNEIFNVLNTSFKKYSSLKFKEYDYFFYFGDVNSRLNLTMSDKIIQDLIKNHSKTLNGDFNDILIHDQFKQYQKESSLILQMDEAPIKFSPTYKYTIGSSEYDANKKRIPSWTDRIMFKKFSETIPLAYNKCLLSLSDHQPVYGLYRIKTEEIDKSKKQMIMTEIIKEKAQNIRGYERKTELSNGDIEENFFS